jgi:DNA-binding LytR/AlgR family response regulator
MTGLAILAVDDEAPALDELSYLLDSSPLVDRVAVATSATAGLRKLHDAHFDVVLLDVRMPGLDGMELARLLGRFAEPPAVIFVTAHEDHALEAFEVGAAGYLLKPVDAVRLDQVLRRALAARGTTAAASQGATSGDVGDVVPVDAGNRTILVARRDITWIESAGDYVRLHVRDGSSHLLRTPMAVLEEHWGERGFVRIHRSYLVAVREITELRTDGSHTSVHVAGQELPVSRRHVRDLHDRLVRHSRPHAR